MGLHPHAVMFTYSGKIDLANPRAEDICIEDIAHALAAENRFNGATCVPYSVAQHSVYASQIVPPEAALAALLHYATEAYVKDVHRPLKRLIERTYLPIEARVWVAIAVRFDLGLALPESVKHADEVLCATEIRDLIRPSALRDESLAVLPAPMPGEIVPTYAAAAEQMFLTRFRELAPAHRARFWDCL